VRIFPDRIYRLNNGLKVLCRSEVIEGWLLTLSNGASYFVDPAGQCEKDDDWSIAYEEAEDNSESELKKAVPLELNKVYTTEKGDKVRIICVDKESVEREGVCAVGLVRGVGHEYVVLYSLDGAALHLTGSDIVAEYKEPVTVEGWVNVHPYGQMFFYKTLGEANAAGMSTNRISCVKVFGSQEP